MTRDPPDVPFSTAERIRSAERDRELHLDDAKWPPAGLVLKHWRSHGGALRRSIVTTPGDSSIPTSVQESVLRFPSAPLHSLQRIHEHHVRLGSGENFHTYRLLQASTEPGTHVPVRRIFLMHIGLNERDNMGLYYRIASHLIHADAGTACIVRPFPSHMTRFPFQGFAETPLDRYLWDGSQLFRQFLRYMIETQWFLSVLARRSSYRCPSGANLLAESDDVGNSRLDAQCLASAISASWHRLYAASETTLQRARGDQPDAPGLPRHMPDEAQFRDSIVSLRDALHLDADHPGCAGSLDENGDVPKLHVLGYSLGGFTAQSIFMSWPFLISSCVTLLAGGALRELAPTAFAHPEEWQTVLHGLRYELDDHLLSMALEEEPGTARAGRAATGFVAGLDHELFTYFKRTFYEVFQQDYKGSFQTRLAAFRQSMLFIVGGNDPVVRPRTVLDSAPPGGINLLEVGALGHQLGGRADTREEEDQRSFWLPEMAALIHRFADKAAEVHDRERPLGWFDAELAHPAMPKAEWDVAVDQPSGKGAVHIPAAHARDPVQLVSHLAPTELIAIEGDGALPGGIFERCLDDALARVAYPTAGSEGVLFILRNEVPTMLHHPGVIREQAAALYHDDLRIARYCHGALTRRRVAADHIERICVVLPWNVRRMTRLMDAKAGYPSQSETAGGQVLERVDHDALWSSCAKTLKGLSQGRGAASVRLFDGGPLLPDPPPDRAMQKLISLASKMSGGEPLRRVATVPDCWVWMSRDFLNVRPPTKLTITTAIEELPRAVSHYCASNEVLLDRLRSDEVRVIAVSRARFNPRFRGRLVVTAPPARRLLIHLALCASLAKALGEPGVNRLLT